MRQPLKYSANALLTEEVLAQVGPSRIAVYEIDYGEMPDAVAISEAVQLVSDLSTDDSPAFVNGVLRAIATSRVG